MKWTSTTICVSRYAYHRVSFEKTNIIRRRIVIVSDFRYIRRTVCHRSRGIVAVRTECRREKRNLRNYTHTHTPVVFGFIRFTQVRLRRVISLETMRFGKEKREKNPLQSYWRRIIIIIIIDECRYNIIHSVCFYVVLLL